MVCFYQYKFILSSVLTFSFLNTCEYLLSTKGILRFNCSGNLSKVNFYTHTETDRQTHTHTLSSTEYLTNDFCLLVLLRQVGYFIRKVHPVS